MPPGAQRCPACLPAGARAPLRSLAPSATALPRARPALPSRCSAGGETVRRPREHSRVGHPPAQPLLLETSFQLLLGSLPAPQLLPWPACPPAAGGTRGNARPRRPPTATPACGLGLLPEVAEAARARQAGFCHPSNHLRRTHCAQQRRRWKEPAHTESRPTAAHVGQDLCAQSCAAQPRRQRVPTPGQGGAGRGENKEEKNSSLIGKASREKSVNFC